MFGGVSGGRRAGHVGLPTGHFGIRLSPPTHAHGDLEATAVPVEPEPWHEKLQRWLWSAKAKTNKQKLGAESSTQKQRWKYLVLYRNRSKP